MNSSILIDNLGIIISYFSVLLSKEMSSEEPNSEMVSEIRIAINTLEETISLLIDTHQTLQKWIK